MTIPIILLRELSFDMPIRIGYPSGFWGDYQSAPQQLLELTNVDYLGMDYLAEVTMAILKRQQANNDNLGYARDFPSLVGRLVDDLVENDVSLVANAGGVNPTSCVDAVLDNVPDSSLTVAAVTGDDVLEQIDELRSQNTPLENMDTGDSFKGIEDDLVAANAYLGAFPIAEALDKGADIVVTGRCVDAALVLGPLIHEYGWQRDEYDRLASGIVAGHLLECGTQVTGGVFTDWKEVNLENMGYPIAEIDENGDFIITKPEKTGGMVTESTVKEQLTYEVKDPNNYVTPDVIADFTTPQIDYVDTNRVRVTGCKGQSRPASLKVTVLYEDGYKAQSLFVYSWPDALEKARTAADLIAGKIEDLPIEEHQVDFVGYDGCHNGISDEPDEPNEILLRFSVKAREKSTIREFGRQALPVLISGPPHVSPLVPGLPKPDEVLAFWPTTIPRDSIEPAVEIRTTGGES